MRSLNSILKTINLSNILLILIKIAKKDIKQNLFKLKKNDFGKIEFFLAKTKK